MSNRFQTRVLLESLHGVKLKEKPFRVEKEVVYRTCELEHLTYISIPAGYRTDFASIPRFFWRILPPTGAYRNAALIHDYLCDVEPKVCDHVAAADVFREAMRDLNVPRWKVAVMGWAVEMFGPKFDAQ